MIQFYALSVLANVLAGLVVASEAGNGKGFFGAARKLFEENNIRFGLGLASLVIAFFKLLSPIEGDVPVIGDFLPVIAGLATGGILLFDFFRGSSDIRSPTVDRIESGIVAYRKYIGLGAALTGILHFFMPTVPIF